jgi:hypothetical protein
MNLPRSVSQEEKGVLSALLHLKADTLHFIDALDNLLVQEMSDGGMGSLLLIPEGMETSNRSFGKQIVAGEFTDSDGVPVSVTINTDGDSRLYELDVWKVNFAPLFHWPDPAAIRITE